MIDPREREREREERTTTSSLLLKSTISRKNSGMTWCVRGNYITYLEDKFVLQLHCWSCFSTVRKTPIKVPQQLIDVYLKKVMWHTFSLEPNCISYVTKRGWLIYPVHLICAQKSGELNLILLLSFIRAIGYYNCLLLKVWNSIYSWSTFFQQLSRFCPSTSLLTLSFLQLKFILFIAIHTSTKDPT